MMNWHSKMNLARMAAALLAVVRLLSFPAHAESVPQTSVSDYVFTTPRLTNHIHGVIMDATNAYRVIRSEDVDWLREAFREREYIGAGAMPSTNWTEFGVGPKVKRMDRPLRYIETGWLDGDAPLVTTCRLYWDEAFTNVYELTSYTNGFTNAYSVITMPMTNGTTSVFTNCWTNSSKMFPVRAVVTNVSSRLIDYCHGVYDKPFPAYSNAMALAWWRVNETRIPTARYFADALVALRGTVRLADDPGGSCNWTNRVRTIKDREMDFGGQTYYEPISTNFSGAVVYDFSASEWDAERELTDVSTVDAYTRFHSSIVTNRVSAEAAYAHCWFSYYSGSDNHDNDFHFTKYAAVRLANPVLDTSGEMAFCRVLLDAHSICSTCASAAGVPAPPSSLSYRTSEGRSESWYLFVENITILYRITPATRLPGW